MTEWLRHLRYAINLRSRFLEWGRAGPPRASSIILGMTLVMAVVLLAARALTNLFTAT